MNSVTKGSRPGPKVISLHLTLNIGLPQVYLFNRFVPYWCILFLVQSFISAHRDEKIWIRVVTFTHLTLLSYIFISPFPSLVLKLHLRWHFGQESRRKDHYSLQHKGQIFHCFPPCQGKTVGFPVAQEEHRAAQVLCAPLWASYKDSRRWGGRSGVWLIICNLNKCHQLGCITYVCPLNAKK